MNKTICCISFSVSSTASDETVGAVPAVSSTLLNGTITTALSILLSVKSHTRRLF